MKTHAPKKVPCPGCSKRFISYSALVLHFEANTCQSELDQDWVDGMAHYYSEKGREGYLWKAHTYSDYPWKCPTCNTEVRFMSSLLQHIESDACAEELWKGALADVTRCYLNGRYGVFDDEYNSDSTDSWY